MNIREQYNIGANKMPNASKALFQETVDQTLSLSHNNKMTMAGLSQGCKRLAQMGNSQIYHGTTDLTMKLAPTPATNSPTTTTGPRPHGKHKPTWKLGHPQEPSHSTLAVATPPANGQLKSA